MPMALGTVVMVALALTSAEPTAMPERAAESQRYFDRVDKALLAKIETEKRDDAWAKNAEAALVQDLGAAKDGAAVTVKCRSTICLIDLGGGIRHADRVLALMHMHSRAFISKGFIYRNAATKNIIRVFVSRPGSPLIPTDLRGKVQGS